MVSKKQVVQYLNRFGICYHSTIAFIKSTCKIDLGFEAQRVGLNIPSATTTGLITYILGQLNELSVKEQLALRDEIITFRKNREAFEDSAFGSQLYNCVWATAQCLCGLLSLNIISQSDVEKSIKYLYNIQSSRGGWSFSGVEEDKIIYAPYSVLALKYYHRRFGSDNILDSLQKAYNYTIAFKPNSNIDKIIREWLLITIEKTGITTSNRFKSSIKIDYVDILDNEFFNYVVYEHSIYPFSMQLFTPASFLFTRKFIKPDHPFNLYLIKYLIDNQLDGQSWSHITSDRKHTAYSFCTALSIYSLYLWAHDMIECKSAFRSFPAVTRLYRQVRILSYKAPRIFISYSSLDRYSARKIAQALRKRDCEIWFDEWEIRVGDSIIDNINRGIIESDFLLILLSENSVKSAWVKEELNAAKMREINKKHTFILPVLLQECNIPPLISDKKYADFRTSFRAGINEITKVVEEINK